MKLNGAVKWYAAAGLASLLVLVAGWFLLVSPQQTNASEIAAQAEGQVASNEVTQHKIDALKAEFANLPTLQQQLAKAQQKLPATPQLPALLRSMSTTATKAGVVLKSVSPSAPQPLAAGAQQGATSSAALAAPGSVNVIPVTIMVQGNFANVRLFLSSLEAMPRSVLVTGVSIVRSTASTTGSTATAGGNQLTATVTARVFSANPGAAAPAAPTTTTAATTTTAG